MRKRPLPAFRFLYRKIGAFGWQYLNAAYNTPEGAAALVKRWNRQYTAQQIEWRADECFPTDIDYPGRASKYASK